MFCCCCWVCFWLFGFVLFVVFACACLFCVLVMCVISHACAQVCACLLMFGDICFESVLIEVQVFCFVIDIRDMIDNFSLFFQVPNACV